MKLVLKYNYGICYGPITSNAFHKHYAHQISISIGPSLHLSLNGDDRYCSSVYIPKNQLHKLTSQGDQLTLLINPLSTIGHYIAENPDDVISNKGLISQLSSVLQEHNQLDGDLQDFFYQVDQLLQEYVCTCNASNHTSDDRIHKALQYLDEHFNEVVSLSDIAQHVHLSESRFLHLFKERTGLTFRRYQLWNRMIKSLPHLHKKSITETAHLFGFADSSHFSRTCKETFGLTPKEILVAL